MIIGDVSGHGVPAGLVMMLVQNSIKISLAHNPQQNPSRLLTVINDLISEDIRKISEDKYMTITVLAVHENGHFNFSGLHQDIMVYRAATGGVDLVETRGMWLGVMQDISTYVSDDVVDMEINDVMLVYTDGITEAWRKGALENLRDPESDMFGESRLARVLEVHGKTTPAEIQKAILAGLENYTCHDDVTLVVLKRTR